ncbi:TonB-dependent receptor [Sinorhizobium sp. BG8]|uniref:TonB-dependent receptor domain-containing protein n=1 Tax=Sinorhizobium sp. BG8 TaxID=2613773 RepID=UPI001FEDF801|nr:TonB-dependent receptor [Sinorhizobium sp. BG8]
MSEYSWDLIRNFSFDPLEFSSDGDAARLYANVTWDVSNDLQFEGGAYATWIDNGDVSRKVDPRIGVAWAPIENHWLRAYYRQDTQMPTNYTLSPISTVGLAPLDLSLFIGGQTETAAVRWDAEWSERFFTAVEYQHQTFDGVAMEIPGLLGYFDTITGKIDRFSISANYWIGGGLGAFGTMSWNDSEDTTPVTGGDFGVPLIPDYVGQVGFTYVSEARWKATVAQTFVGPRVGAKIGAEIDDYNTTDIAFGWKSDSGHLEAGLQLLNAFDNDFEVAYGIPGPGRTILGTIRAKF